MLLIVLPVMLTAVGVLLTRQVDFISRGVEGLLFLFVPPVVALLLFRLNPLDYGLRIGRWKHGIAYGVVGVLITIVVVRLAMGLFPSLTDYYGSRDLTPRLIADTFLYMFAWEFIIRGYLFNSLEKEFSLGEANAGQTAVFAISHFGKPMVELLSTPFTGLVFGLVAHRTRSIHSMVVIHTVIQLAVY